MEWVKLAAVPAYYIDGALLRAGEAAEVLFCRGLAHCGGVESAGLIDKTVLPMLIQTKPQARADALVREGLWLDEGTHYRIRSWDKWQDQHDVAAEKRRKDRERQRALRRKKSQEEDASHADVSQRQSRDSHSDIRDSHNVEGEGEGEGERDQQRTTSSVAAPAAKAKRATSIPDTWPPDEETGQRLATWAAENAPAVNLRSESEQWQDWHRATGVTRKDWAASWRLWMKRAQGDASRRPSGQLALVNRSEQRTLQNVALIEHFRQQEQGA